MRAVLDILFIVIQLYIWILIAQAVLSLLVAFNVVNPRNQLVSLIWRFTHAVTEPLLGPIRSVVRPVNGIDLSPMVLILGLILIERVVIHYVYPNVI